MNQPPDETLRAGLAPDPAPPGAAAGMPPANHREGLQSSSSVLPPILSGQPAWHCLHEIIAKLDDSSFSIEDGMEYAATALQELWGDADALHVNIRYEDREYGAVRSAELSNAVERMIVSRGKQVGAIAVGLGSPSGRLAWQPEAAGVAQALAWFLGAFIGWRQDIANSRLQDQQFLQADKMAALGTLISGLAHEINNPAHMAMLSAQNLADAWKTLGPVLDKFQDTFGDFRVGHLPYAEFWDMVPAQITVILEGLQRIQNIVAELRDYVRQYPVHRDESVDMNLVVKSAVVLLTGVLRKSTQHFHVVYGESLPPIWGDYQRLEQVVINLIDNACRALPDPKCGVLVLTSYDRDVRSVIVTITDEGVGIPPDDLHRITDPFFTTRRAEGASGLGLAVSRGIVAGHGGQLNFVSASGRGTTVRVILPVASS